MCHPQGVTAGSATGDDGEEDGVIATDRPRWDLEIAQHFHPLSRQSPFHLWPVAASKRSIADRKSKMAGMKGSNL